VVNTLAYYDTFSSQLWSSGLIFYRMKNHAVLQQISDKNKISELATAQLSGETPRFYWEFPQNLEVLLQPHIKLRALTEVFKLNRKDSNYELKNTDEKTVARMIVSEYRRNTRNGKLFLTCVRAQPVRGYHKEFATLNKWLQERGLKIFHSNVLQTCFETFDAWPQSFSAKPRLNTDESDVSRDVICSSIKDSLALAHQCEPGIIADIDTEFLHDYRVCLRSIRSVLSQVKNLFPAEDQEKLLKELSDLGSRTNSLRDLDVYLLKEDKYKTLLPPELGKALNPLFTDFRRKRSSEQKKLQRYLESDAYQSKVRKLYEFIDKAHDDEQTDISQQPISRVAASAIHQQFEKMLKKGRKLHEKISDEKLHSLRIQCKKFRYLLEFFGDLFPQKTIRQLVSTMKTLQNTLGDFNDLSVQQEELMSYIASKQNPKSELSVAVGALIGLLHRKQKRLKNRVGKMFDELDTAKTQELVARLSKV
jgi:CHAD domain-containing protein